MRIWDVSLPEKKKASKLLLENQMVTIINKHKEKISKVEFCGDTNLISASHDKTIMFWELLKISKPSGEYYYKPNCMLKVVAPLYFLDIALTSNRLICRKGKPNTTLKVIKFRSLKDIKAEMFTSDFYERVQKNHKKRNEPV